MDCIGSLSLPTRTATSKSSSTPFHIKPIVTVSDDPMDLSTMESSTSESSFSIPDEEKNCYQLVLSGFPKIILSLIFHPNPRVVSSSLRALKSIYSSSCVPRTPFQSSELTQITKLLKENNFSIIEQTANFLMKICNTGYLPVSEILKLIPKESDPRFPTYSQIPECILTKSISYTSTIQEIQFQMCPDIVSLLLDNLRNTSGKLEINSYKIIILLIFFFLASILLKTSILGSLAQISFENEPISLFIFGYHKDYCIVQSLLNIVKNGETSTMKLQAAHCITNLSRAKTFENEHYKSLQLIVIPTLLRLIDSKVDDRESIMLQEQVPLVLARLIENDRVLQQTTMETGCTKITGVDFLKELSKPHLCRVLSNRILVLASVCSLFIGGRKPVTFILPTIGSFLSHESSIVRASACRVIQSLSRSLKQLRTSLVDEGISVPLFEVYMVVFFFITSLNFLTNFLYFLVT